MQQLSLNLTVDEINLILEALGERPYKQAVQLVDKIQAQSAAQLQRIETSPQASETSRRDPVQGDKHE